MEGRKEGRKKERKGVETVNWGRLRTGWGCGCGDLVWRAGLGFGRRRREARWLWERVMLSSLLVVLVVVVEDR